ncbi:MAG: GNAT family N-acetyltransferase [Pseudomonadota bacterium]
MNFTIRRLDAADAGAFRALRMRGLVECPLAFAASPEDEAGEPDEAVGARLADRAAGAVYGAFTDDGRLAGVVGLGRERMRKLAHKAVLWGMYVAPEARRRGVAQALVKHLLAEAAMTPGLRQVTLGVHTGNRAARALYESFGFVAWGTEPAAAWVDGAAHDETWMVRVLHP